MGWRAWDNYIVQYGQLLLPLFLVAGIVVAGLFGVRIAYRRYAAQKRQNASRYNWE